MSGKNKREEKPKKPRQRYRRPQKEQENRRLAVAEQHTCVEHMSELGTRLKLASIIGG